ncbi:hypothetical protein F5Y04DRAFT_45601 [Hypomontagnella monticulosa]|nr:hypothetical protein F5Y04DRAFT_45601 [Hypomontagnella monticulosa]
MAPRDEHEPVAIVGMGCRWPGGVRNAPELWEFLRDRTDGWREFDDPRFSAKGFHHPNSNRPGTMAMRGAFLADGDARLFDHAFFGMTGLEVETLDPSQRKLLEVTYEALENAGETWDSVSGSRTGVFVGNFCLDHWMIQSRDWDNPRPYAFTGAGTSILANRISYIFNLQGPSLTVDTACSSSMYALHLAMNSIRAGDCDSAIVASSNWIADPGVTIALDKLGALSASARCHTFDARAEGYARGEGFAAIYLKRPSLAIATGSPIRAMIRGTAINANGRTGGITRPSAAGQEAVIREAYRNAGNLPFSDTNYFECHGTGTYVGDPIEVAAVGRVFAPERSSEDPMLVGSVKSNVGHSEGASALASIMKVVLSLENGAIPPLFNLQTLNPNIDFDGAKVKPVTELTPWPKGRLWRASINSFGYGGANGHCILDHVNNVLPDYIKPGIYRSLTNGSTNGTNGTNGDSKTHRVVVECPKLKSIENATTRKLVLLPLSAHNEPSLKLNVEALSQAINKFPLADVAYTLSARRSRLPQRHFCIVDKDNVVEGLTIEKKPVRAPLNPSNLGFVFTGQGAQWHAMGAELFEYRVFQTAIDHLDHVLSSLPTPPSWTLRDILSGNCDADLIQTAEVSQTACTAVQVGLVDLLASWSVRPSGVAGHSSGEMAAAYASGRITAAEAIVAAYFRGQAVSKNEQTGAMLAVGLGPEQVSKYLEGLEDQVKLAAINSQGSVTLSGEVPAIDKLSEAMNADSVFNRKLKTGGNAYHSHHMLPLGRNYIDILTNGLEHIQKQGLLDKSQRYALVPWASSVTPDKTIGELENHAAYWRSNLESPVRFSEAITNLVNLEETTINAIVEIGPHPALKSPIDQIVKAAGKTVAYASTLKRQEDARVSLLTLAGTLFGVNSEIDLVAVNAVDGAHGSLEHGCTSIDLPPYQYTYGALNYHESRASKEYRYRKIPRHDLLGSKVVGNAKLRPQWRNILRMKDVPWLGDHRLIPDAVLPAAGYLAMAVEAAGRIYNEFPEPAKITGFSLRDVSIKTSLPIPEDDYGVEVLTSMELVDTATAKSPAWATFSISSVDRESNEWSEHCTGLVKVEISESEDSEKIVFAEDSSRATDSKAWYKKFAAIGLGYGATFQPLSDIRADADKNLASAKVALNTTADLIKGGESPYPLHPASLDGAIQLGLIASHGGRIEEAHTAFVPVQVGQLYLKNGIEGDSCTAVVRGERRGIRAAWLDLQMLGPNGEVLLNVDNLRCISYSSESKSSDHAFTSPFTRLVWKPDIRSLSNRQCRAMFPPPKENVEKSPLWGVMNKLAFMVVYAVYDKFGRTDDGPKPTADVGHFFEWTKRRSHLDMSPEMEEARSLSTAEREAKINELVSQAPDVMEVKIAKLLHDNMADILYQRRTGVDVIIAEGLLTPLYQTGLLMTGVYPQLYNVLNSLSHANPNLRILEVGGGTGGATRIAMKAFRGPNGIKRYREYTFTDISAGFLGGARESLSEFKDMNFSVFDAEVDPVEQGYEPVYDLVIACQVLHATSSMKNTLTNVRKLLKPGGQLLLVETNKNFMVPGVVVGTFTGYWAGIPDGRVDAPFQSLEAWDKALQNVGFSGLDIVLDDFPEPHNTTSVILSTYKGEPAAKKTASINLLYSAETAPALLDQLTKELEGRGVSTKVGPLNEAPTSVSQNSRVVVFLDDKHLLQDATEQDITTFQHLARSTASLVVITSCGTAKGRNPDGALIPGLLRVLSTENPAGQYVSIDIDADNFAVSADDAEDLVRSIVDKESELHQPPSTDDEEGNPKDREFVWQDGSLCVSRLVPDGGFHSQHGIDSQSVKTEQLPLDSQGAVRAAFETPGVLSSLYFKAYQELWQPLPADYIDVKVAAVGLNSKDIEHWSGRSDANNLSSEYTGTITAVGSAVTDLKVGDRVYGLGKGQFGNFTRVPASLAQKLQPDDDLVQMATLPLVYVTAIYAFEHATHLRKGQNVLVQAATSDLGLAALRFAQAKGANVFALVDTPEKARFLSDELSVPTTHVILSSDPSNLRRAAGKTRKGGFDVIINTAQSENLHASLQALAPLGHFIDVGQVDAQSAKAIGSELFQKNANFSSIDPFVLLDSDPELGEELIQAVDKYYRQGLIQPIRPVTATDVSQLSQVLMDFSKGNLIGKLVATFNPESVVRMVPPSPTARFDSEAAYVITGGLGGLGLSLVRWMADHGARHLAVLSRRSVDTVPEAKKLVETLASRGVQVEPVVCDVSNKDQVTSVIQKIASARPIKGVVHAAVSYLDLSFDKLEVDRWRQSLSAKVQGTKNLHEATLNMPLDFFVMTTSLLSVYALATQGAYTAGNNFQDLFARYRRNLGLPASTASFSLISDAGSPYMDPITVDTFERNKTLTLSEHQFLTLLEPAFLNNTTSVETKPDQWFGQQDDPLSVANLLTCLDPAGMLAKKRDEIEAGVTSTAALPRWYTDGRVSLIMRAFSDAQRHAFDGSQDAAEGSKSTVARLRREFDAAIQAGAGERANTITFVQNAITNTVAEMLFVDAEAVDPAKSVADHGVDSLIAAELRNWFHQALGTNISMLDLLDPSMKISALSEKITDDSLNPPAESS